MLSLFHVGHNYWHPIIATSFSQHNSSEFSHIMPEDFGEHLIRDQRPFSSYRISPDPSDSHLHDGAASLLHLTHLLQGSGQRTETAMVKDSFCAQWPIFVFILMLFWIVVLVEDPNTAHYKISNRGSQILIFYLLVFDRIHDAMHLNKMFRTSSRKTGPQH